MYSSTELCRSLYIGITPRRLEMPLGAKFFQRNKLSTSPLAAILKVESKHGKTNSLSIFMQERGY